MLFSLTTTSVASTLLDIYRMAQQNSTEWQNIQVQQQQRELEASVADSGLKPQLGLSASYGYQWIDSNAAQVSSLSNTELTQLNQCLLISNDYNQCLNEVAASSCGSDPACIIGQNGSDQNITSTVLGVQLTQPLYNAVAWYNSKQANIQTTQGKAKQLSQQQAFLATLIESYLLTLSTRETLAATEAELQQRQQQLSSLESQFEKGLVPASDVLYGRAMLGLQQSQVDTKKRDARDAFRSLEAVTQQPLTKVAHLRADIPMPKPNPSNVEQWTKLAQARNPNLGQLRYQVQMAEMEIQKKKGQRKPKVNLVGSMGTTSTQQSGSFDQNSNATSAQIKVELSLPLYSGGALTNQVKTAISLHNQSQLQLKSAQESVFSDIETAFNAASSGLNQLQWLDQVIESLELRLKNVENGFEKGVISAQDVLEAREELFKTRRNKQITRFEYIRASITLKKLAGILNQQDIAVIASWSDSITISGAQQTLFDQSKEWLSY